MWDREDSLDHLVHRLPGRGCILCNLSADSQNWRWQWDHESLMEKKKGEARGKTPDVMRVCPSLTLFLLLYLPVPHQKAGRTWQRWSQPVCREVFPVAFASVCAVIVPHFIRNFTEHCPFRSLHRHQFLEPGCILFRAAFLWVPGCCPWLKKVSLFRLDIEISTMKWE